VKDLIITNVGPAPVAVGPGTSNGFLGPLAGTTPTFTIPVGSQARWHSAAGFTVDSTHKTIKLDPGASVAAILVSIGGA
jgi:hypothetical protein